MTRSRLDEGNEDAMALLVLGPSLINWRQNASIGPLFPIYERAKDDRHLSFHLNENETIHV